MKFARSFFIILFILPFLAIDCIKKCEINLIHKFSWSGVEVANLNNTERYPAILIKDSISAKAFGIQLKIKITDTTNSKGDGRCFTYSPVDSITGIKIYTINYFNSQNGPESDVSDYFKIRTSEHYQELSYNSYITLGKFLGSNYQNTPTFESFKEIQLMLTEAPEKFSSHQFRIKVEMKDSVFTAETKPVIFYQ